MVIAATCVEIFIFEKRTVKRVQQTHTHTKVYEYTYMDLVNAIELSSANFFYWLLKLRNK